MPAAMIAVQMSPADSRSNAENAMRPKSATYKALLAYTEVAFCVKLLATKKAHGRECSSRQTLRCAFDRQRQDAAL